MFVFQRSSSSSVVVAAAVFQAAAVRREFEPIVDLRSAFDLVSVAG